MKSSRLFLSILCGSMLSFSNSFMPTIDALSPVGSVEVDKQVSQSSINVKSEIAPLKIVLLHRPGKELLNLTPSTLEKLLFDDIPFLKLAQQEHDEFAKVLKDNGVEVVYLEDLAAEAISVSDKVRGSFIDQFVNEASEDKDVRDVLSKYLNGIKDSKELILKTMEGIRVKDVAESLDSLPEEIASLKDDTLLADPMPNLYFTRDNFASVGNGVTINKMFSETRNREVIYAQFIFTYHPDYKNTKRYYSQIGRAHV